MTRRPASQDNATRALAASALERYSGVVLSEALREGLDAAVAAAAEEQELSPIDLVHRACSGDEGALRALAEYALIGETYFFRHPEHFEALTGPLMESLGNPPSLKLWSAGCATGEEAYSLAMALREAGRAPGQDRVIATDLSERALARARAGAYGPWSFRRLPNHLRDRYFQTSGKQWVIDPALARAVEFSRQNLVSDAAPGVRFDAIFCRNVLIYFQPALAARVVERLAGALRPGGFLVLGVAELPLAASVGLEQLEIDGRVVLRRPAGGALPRARRASPPTPVRPVRATPGAAPPAVRPTPPSSPPVSLAPAAKPASSPPASAKPASTPPASTFDEARAAADAGQLGRASELASRLATEQQLPEAHLLLAVIAEAQDDLEGAVRAVRRALYLEPRLPMGHAMLAALQQRLGLAEQSEHSRANALRILRELGDAEPLRAVEAITAGSLRRALERTGVAR